MPQFKTQIDALDVHFILIHYNQLDRGGHFAAWEQPQLFCEEMRASFRSLRRSS